MFAFATRLPLVSLRSGICLGVVLAHGAAFGLAALTTHPQYDDFGGAPVIELTLSPSMMFDGPDGARNTSSGGAASAAAKSSTAPNVLRDAEPSAPKEAPKARLNDQPEAHASKASQPVNLPLPAVTPPASGATSPVAGTQKHGTGHAQTQGDGQGDTQGRDHGQASQAGATQGNGAATLGASAQSGVDAYEATVIGWIERHKSHPGGANGTVTMAFTLDRRGNLRSSRVLKSSGIRYLDAVAIEQLRAAAPFPRPPAGTSWQTRDFRVRMDYQAAGRR